MIDWEAQAERFKRGTQGVPVHALNCVRRAMPVADNMDPEAIKRFIRKRSDDDLRRVALLGPKRISVLRAWAGQEAE